MGIIVIGLGNVSFADDGIGVQVARLLRNRVVPGNVTIVDLAQCGLDVLETLTGYRKAIIIDAIRTHSGVPGTVYRFNPGQACPASGISPHEIDILAALELGRRLGMALPDEIVIFAIEAQDISTPAEECTALVKTALPVCADMVARELATMNAAAVKSNKPNGGQYAG